MEAKMQVYAVVRIDGTQVIEESVTVKEILPTLEEAAEEAERLNRLNEDKNAHYFWQATRYFPEGRTVAASGLVRDTAEAERIPLRT